MGLVYKNLDLHGLIFGKINWDFLQSLDFAYFLDSDGNKCSIEESKDLLTRMTIWPPSSQIIIHGFKQSASLCARGVGKSEITYYEVLKQLDIFFGQFRDQPDIIRLYEKDHYVKGIYYEFMEDSNLRPMFVIAFKSL